MNRRLYYPLFLILFIAACKKDKDKPAAGGPRPVTASSSRYISQVLEYKPAPGQFINESIGTPAGAQQLIGNVGNIVTLGGYGGYIVVGFDHSIINNTGNEIAVYGNPLVGTGAEWSEPGIVQVMQDANGNGLPDDDWYELAGSEHERAETVANYKITYYNPKAKADVTWKDNRGNTGAVKLNSYHDHNYYPLFAANQDSISFGGTLLKSTFIDGGIAVNLPFTGGYADNGSADVVAQSAPRFNTFDISNAKDKNGTAVQLAYIDFIRIYTAQNHPGNDQTGEISTELLGIRDMNMP